MSRDREPKPGDFGVVRTGGIAARLIRVGTRSTVNHAFVAVSETEIVEAQPGGAVISPIDKYPDIIWSDVRLGDASRWLIVAWALKQLGVPYGWPDIAALTLATFGIKSKTIARRIERQDRLICSQLVDKAYEKAGIHLFTDGRLPGQVTPGDLLNIITASTIKEGITA